MNTNADTGDRTTKFDAMNRKIRRIAQIHQAGHLRNHDAFTLVDLADFIFGEQLAAPADAWSPGIGADQNIHFFKGTVGNATNMDIVLVVGGVTLDLSLGITTSARDPRTTIFVGDDEVCSLDVNDLEAKRRIADAVLSHIEKIAETKARGGR